VLRAVRRGPVHGDRRVTDETGRRRPRVVIFAGEGAPAVEVLELPEGAGVGARFQHLGTVWEITGLRSRSRVLVAEPARH
jgi:hypothetical protein